MSAVTLTIDEKGGPDGMRIGTVTSNLNESISIAAYVGAFGPAGQTFKPPLSTLMTTERWHPSSGWLHNPIGFCGTGLGSYELKAGSSVKVHLSGYLPRGDGIWRYRLPYVRGDGKTQGIAYSPPFVVDTSGK